MGSQLLVLNEWILHDLRGDKGPARQNESLTFLRDLFEKCDRIALLRDSTWSQKAYDLMKQTDVAARECSRFLHLWILRNSAKCVMLETASVEVPSELAANIKPDDHYLIETYLASGADLLVTEDGPLRDVLIRSGKINSVMRDEFLTTYQMQSKPPHAR